MKNMKLMELEDTLSIIAGVIIEITIRGEKKFTFSFEGENDIATKKIENYFAPVPLDREYDKECDLTCLYMSL